MKRHLAHEKTQASPTQIHYGKRFAETEERMAVKVMNRELEEISGISAASPEPPPANAKPNPVPIGALPTLEEPPEGSALQMLWDMGHRQWETAQSAAVDLTRAGVRLLSLPFDAAKLLAQRFRFKDA